jgi:translation initiation factor 6
MLLKGILHNSPFVGIFLECNEELAVAPTDLSSAELRLIENSLNVSIHKTMFSGSPLIGSLMVMNNKGAIVTDFATKEDLEFLKGYNLLFIEDRINAVGNDILANDVAAIVHPDFEERSVKEISDVLDVEVIKKDLGGIKTVGSAAVITKKGILVNPQVSDEDLKFLSDFFKVPAVIATANFGSLYLGASIIANSRGAIVGELSTTIEIGKIEENLF